MTTSRPAEPQYSPFRPDPVISLRKSIRLTEYQFKSMIWKLQK